MAQSWSLTSSLCALIVPSVEAPVTDPRPEFFLPWKNHVFYDGPGGWVTDWVGSGNYDVCGYL